MTRINLFLLTGLLLSASCDGPKPRPISNNFEKTKVMVNGKKDSVLNNQQKNYGSATVSDPCVKCLLQLIQRSDSFKTATESLRPEDIVYTVDWMSAKNPVALINGHKINSGMQVNVIQKVNTQQVNLSTYLFSNATSQLYLLSDVLKYEPVMVKIDSVSLKAIRNSCFWGVASAK